MADIQIEVGKAERLIAQILRDERKFLPEEANRLAEYLCQRLSLAMPLPTNQPLQYYRMIRSFPPQGSDFGSELSRKIADVDDHLAGELWRMVYERAEDLPSAIADSRRY